MNFKFFYLSFLCSVFMCLLPEQGQSATKSASEYLVGKLNPLDKRYQTFKKALELMQERNSKCIVETGTARDGLRNFEGDGGSSIIFSEWAFENDACFYSVDISQDNITSSRAGAQKNLYQKSLKKGFLKKFKANLHFVVHDSVSFLKNFNQPIDMLYLDSYDFDFNDPLPSQIHHLKEIEAVYPALHPNSIIMIDDCDLPHGGKGKLVIEYLTNLGWKIVENAYQVILVYQE